MLAYLEEAYDLDKVVEISLTRHGAAWIQMGAEVLPKCRL